MVLKLQISGKITNSQSNKVTEFTLEGTSTEKIYADEIIKKLGELGIEGSYKIEKKL